MQQQTETREQLKTENLRIDRKLLISNETSIFEVEKWRQRVKIALTLISWLLKVEDVISWKQK